MLLMQADSFRYKIVHPPDQQWGVKLKNGSFNGMIGMISREVSQYKFTLNAIYNTDNSHIYIKTI